MDKDTLGHYGWIVCAVLILSIMIALADPFAMAMKRSVVGMTNSFGVNLDSALLGSWGDSDDGNENEKPDVVYDGEVNSETGEILDSWEMIITNVNNGTYATKYAVGNYKSLDLGPEGVVNMQIAALDMDVLSDGSGKTRITWVAKEALLNPRVMNNTDTSKDGWAASDLRACLQTEIWSLIPENIQNAIVAVNKDYSNYTTKSILTCSDKIWIPSYREVGFGLAEEESNVVYSGIFNGSASRVKTLNDGTACDWWTRSVFTFGSNGNYFHRVGGNGGSYSYIANDTHGVVIGFCF